VGGAAFLHNVIIVGLSPKPAGTIMPHYVKKLWGKFFRHKSLPEVREAVYGFLSGAAGKLFGLWLSETIFLITSISAITQCAL